MATINGFKKEICNDIMNENLKDVIRKIKKLKLALKELKKI